MKKERTGHEGLNPDEIQKMYETASFLLELNDAVTYKEGRFALYRYVFGEIKLIAFESRSDYYEDIQVDICGRMNRYGKISGKIAIGRNRKPKYARAVEHTSVLVLSKKWNKKWDLRLYEDTFFQSRGGHAPNEDELFSFQSLLRRCKNGELKKINLSDDS